MYWIAIVSLFLWGSFKLGLYLDKDKDHSKWYSFLKGLGIMVPILIISVSFSL